MAGGGANGQEKRKAETNPDYGSGPKYWNKRYKEDTKPFEWLESFVELESLIKEATAGKLTAEVLNVGCGTSPLPENMYDHGYKDIVNIDTAGVCIRQMSEKNRVLRPELKWLEMDATSMSFADASFDTVIDKSTLDTFACGDNAAATIAKYLQEVLRVLRPNGVCLCVSYGAPTSRMDYFKGNDKFAVRNQGLPVKVPGSNPHFVYILRKLAATGKS
eukprot:TRINITY_DN15019_c0_g1_i1.p1 TRINITY_DN15019_c0_g1~~TRINITY_DN15019_c0_g1_i1.p1  ORF type:complete len:218 (+),score=43.47 TRINITY_DN15019_c0_g1_i1:102-755(+)